jgi:hypothetical protein
LGHERQVVRHAISGRRGALAQNVVADIAEMAVPFGRPGTSEEHHHDRVRAAGSQHVEDLWEHEQLPPDLADRLTGPCDLNLVGVHVNSSGGSLNDEPRSLLHTVVDRAAFDRSATVASFTLRTAADELARSPASQLRRASL